MTKKLDPLSQKIRDGYTLDAGVRMHNGARAAEFDQWLESVKLEARREVIRFGHKYAQTVHSPRDKGESFLLKTGANATWLAQQSCFDPKTEED